MTIGTSTRTNYIFVDYENVQGIDLNLIAGKAAKVFLIVGRHRKSLPLDLVRQIHKYHDQVQLIESDGASHNALDLVLAYHVGLEAGSDPNGYLHIVAKDKDYDALIQHLQANNILARRHDEFGAIPALIVMSRLTLGERIKWVVERFQKNKASRPTRKKSLVTTIHAFFYKEFSEAEVQQIIEALIDKKLIELTPQGKVTYRI